MEQSEIFYRIALNSISGIGPVRYKKLIQEFGSAEAIFKEKLKFLKINPTLTEQLAISIKQFNETEKIEKEFSFIEKNKIQIFCFDEDHYPQRLKMCTDSPVMLFQNGSVDWNQPRVISVIGTRSMTEYGNKLCEELIEHLKDYQVMVVSGLAYGVDITIHKKCLDYQIPTVGIVAHGLGMIYPAQHKSIAEKMKNQGAILSEYLSHSGLEKGNFPSRNRIVAGISDATIVVETDRKGGSMITAELAFSYNRDLYCFPGRVNDSKSAGCNYLIKKLKAQLITGGHDFVEEMGWNKTQKSKAVQQKLFLDFTPTEQKIYDVVFENEKIHIDQLMHVTELSNSEIASSLLSLEMQKVLKILPGKLVTCF
ncbi:MAG TPA: DNA-processing protein DprA [Chitinophagaceae bacterium]|nr:MAG: DNA processing protein DprA [Bacteroidetes bacterium OLB11]HMN32664.1 DNA-processing protein DprA [Chitinophagaceae bacterium]